MAEKIAVLGAGSWGIAVANLLAENGHKITLWEFDSQEYGKLIKNRISESRLPGIAIAAEINIVNGLSETLDSEYFLFILPAQKVRSVCEKLSDLHIDRKKFINLAKGVEIDTLKRMSEVIIDLVPAASPDNVATISGPSHAEEVSRGIPTSVVAASGNLEFAKEIQHLFSNQSFRVYRSEDIVGVELGGSLKNVIAIASGIIQGMGFGDNTIGALLTRGQAEIARMGEHLGADPQTFAGLSGIGDLITTCISKHSRNRYVGDRIGRGEKLKDILDSMVMVAEGVFTCRAGYAMARKYEVEMPITTEVYRVLFEDKDPGEAVADLMGRSLKEEVWS